MAPPSPPWLPILATSFSWILCASVVAALPQTAVEEPTAEVPSSPDVTFYMYPTPDAHDSPITETIDDLLPSHPITLVFHGFKGDRTAKSMESIKEALLQTGVNNVVVVDWGPLADHRNASALTAYHRVRDHGVASTADIAVRWLRFVMDYKNISPDQVHLVGFSLGAHVVGMMGHLMNSSLGRITGLDPPKFGYEHVALENRLDMSDAQFVNVIHTSAGILSYTEPIGHVDFFPNGDVMPQQGCPSDGPIQIITCSHYFAFALFAETVYHHNALVATQCSSWSNFMHGSCKNGAKAPMGYATPNTTRGTFYMKTNSAPPYGEDEPQNPLPDNVRFLITYDKGDSLVHPTDVVNFLMHKEPTERSAEGDIEPEIEINFSLESDLEGESKVMRVKTAKGTTTTANPPAFLDNGSPRTSFSAVFLILSGVNVIRTFFPRMNG